MSTSARSAAADWLDPVCFGRSTIGPMRTAASRRKRGACLSIVRSGRQGDDVLGIRAGEELALGAEFDEARVQFVDLELLRSDGELILRHLAEIHAVVNSAGDGIRRGPSGGEFP